MIMRRGNIRAVMLGSALTLATAGCARANETSPPAPTNAPASGVEKLTHQAKDAATTTTAYLVRQKEQLHKSLADKMTSFNKQLSALKAKSEQAGDQAKSEWTNRLARLQQKKQVAAKKLNQLKKSSADKWREIKAGAETAFADLEKALKDAFARSKDDDKSSKQ